MSGQFVHLMKLGMGRHPQVDVVVKVTTLTEVLGYYYDKGEAIAYITSSGAASPAAADETNAIYIAKLKEEGSFLNLLLVRGDPGRGLPAFVNPQTRKIVTLKSDEPGTVRATSSHIVISLQEIAAGDDQGRHRMTMEQASGISRILARDLLGSLLSRYAEEFPDKFEAEKKRRTKKEPKEILGYRPTVRFHPHKNANLEEDLKQGKIGGFKLVRGRKEFQGEANEPKIESLDVQLTARIVPTEDFGKVRALVDHVSQAISDVAFEDLKLQLVDDEGHAIPSPGTISLNADTDEADMRYCKKVTITGVKSDPVECHEDLDDDIVQFSKKAINNDAHWD